jgi:hypothetical protein
MPSVAALEGRVGTLDIIIGFVVVMLVAGMAVAVLVHTYRDLRGLDGPALRENRLDRAVAWLRRLFPLPVKIGAVVIGVATAAVLQLTGSPVRDARPVGAAGEATVFLISSPTPESRPVPPEGLEPATLIILLLLVLIVGVGAPFWYEAVRGRLRAAPPSEASRPAPEPLPVASESSTKTRDERGDLEAVG